MRKRTPVGTPSDSRIFIMNFYSEKAYPIDGYLKQSKLDVKTMSIEWACCNLKALLKTFRRSK